MLFFLRSPRNGSRFCWSSQYEIAWFR